MVAETSLAERADANVQDRDGLTPLMEALMQRLPKSVAALLPASDLSLTEECGRNALHVCVANGTVELLNLLLPFAADARLLDSLTAPVFDEAQPVVCFVRALHLACYHGRHAMVRPLVRHGASLTAVNSQGCTALHIAAAGGDLGTVVTLLGEPQTGPGRGREGGARRGMTPVEVDAPARGGWTALHAAAHAGHTRVCGVLLQAGASLQACLDVSELERALGECGVSPLTLGKQEHFDNRALRELLSGKGPMPLPGTACERCAAVPDSQLMLCGGCRSVRYCCPRCAAADWPQHAAFCKTRSKAHEVVWPGPGYRPSFPKFSSWFNVVEVVCIALAILLFLLGCAYGAWRLAAGCWRLGWAGLAAARRLLGTSPAVPVAADNAEL